MRILSKCRLGQLYEIEKIDGCSLKIKRRLYDLGFLRGVKIKVSRKSLLGKVLLLEIRGYTLSLQKKIADFIVVGE